MIASTWTDPVLGVDIHIILVPTPVGPVPTPLPLPFTGMVLDPAGLAMNKAMGGSLILVNNLPATNCGTNVMNLPPHLPVPGPFADGVPGNDAQLMFGALNVELGGSLAVRLGEIALSCNDPTRLPVSVVIASPKGPLVLVPRPPVPDLKLIATMLAFHVAGMLLKALGKLIGKGIRALQRGIFAEFFQKLSSKLKFAAHEAEGNRFKQLWNDAVCFLTGHPVDVATGRVITSQTDLELFGALPLTFKRRYDTSASKRVGPLGYGWAHPFDQVMFAERGALVLRAEDGREIEFPTLHFPDYVLSPGREVFLARERLTVRAQGYFHFTVTDQHGTMREFARVPGGSEREAKLVRVRNRLGQEQRFAYGPDGTLATVADPAGRNLVFYYDKAKRIERVEIIGTDRVAQIVGVYRYDAAGDLIQATDALGHSYRYEYVEHLLVKETNKNGLSFYFQYDGVDSTARCVRTWGDGGIYDHVITYDEANRRTLVENSLGNVTLYQLNEVGQVVSVTDALGGVTSYEYDHPSGQKTKETDPLGAETTRTYDARGNLTKLEDPTGAELNFEYGTLDQLTRLVDAIGGIWHWGYDAAGRLIGRANPLGQRTQFEWGSSDVIAVVDPAGQRMPLGYDAAGNLVSLTTPDGANTQWTYDGLGRPRGRRDPNQNVRRVDRDALGRVVGVSEPDGNQRTLSYDAEGNVLRAQDRHYDVSFEYSGMNRMAARIQNGTRVEFHYDTEDRLVAVQNEHGFVYRFVLGGTGNVDEEWGFDELRRRYVRDSAGRVLEVTRPEGKTTAYTYDPAGRVVAVQHSDGSQESFAYRADGTLLRANNDGASLVFERDALGRITKELTGAEWVAADYDAFGLRRSLRSSKGLFQTIRRNSVGDVIGIDAEMGGEANTTAPGGKGSGSASSSAGPDRASFSAKFERDRLGLELERQLPGGIRSQWQRDALGRPLRQEIWRGEESRGARQYVWDVNDRLTRVIDAMTGPVDYAHDGFGQLAAAKYPDGRADLRMPDAVSNLFRTSDRTDRKYGPAGQLIEARDARGVTSYAYDAEGNLTKRVDPDGAVWLFAWTGSGLLAQVTRPNGHVVEFSYDALARRIAKRYRGKTTRWIWDGNVPLHEWVERASDAVDEDFSAREREEDSVAANERALKALLVGRPANGPPAKSQQQLAFDAAANGGTADAPVTWLFEPERRAPLAKLVAGKTFGIVTDELGTPRAMFDQRGTEVWSADIDAYGDLRNVRGVRAACPFRWPGQYEDAETGLYYNRFRYYSPESGAYISQDRSRTEGGYALYAYVPDPLTWTDRLGLTPLDEGGYSVYGLYDKGASKPYYIGITNDPERRQAEHVESGRLDPEKSQMRPIKEDLTYAEARGNEQALIEQHQTLTGKIGEDISESNRGNKVNSFDKSRTDERGLRFKEEYLKVKGCGH
jgi:RHS repeat-associated protein